MKNILFAIIFAVVLQFSQSNAQNVGAPGAAPVPLPPTSSSTPPVVAQGFAPIFNYSNKSKIICNYNSILPPDRSDKYTLDDVDSSLCSHVIFNSAYLDPVTLAINNDAQHGKEYETLLALKQKGVSVILSLGGNFDQQTNDRFSSMIGDGAARSQFVANTVSLLKTLKFNGLDINWSFPTCWNGDCNKGHGRLADKGNFVNLLRDLSVAFRYYKFQLMVSVSPLDAIANKAYDVRGIARFADLINLQTYNMYNQSYEKTEIQSAFQGSPPSLVHTVDYWRTKGAPAGKLIVGIPTFGRTFSLANDTWNGVGSPARIGKVTGISVPGMAAYFEICSGLNYQLVDNVGPYAYKGDQWVSFDDITSIKLKGEYIRKNNLAGALISSLDTDDYSGTLCTQGKYPLIRAVRNAVGL